jgi:hypothetical protein
MNGFDRRQLLAGAAAANLPPQEANGEEPLPF